MRLMTLPGVFRPISDSRLLAEALAAERPGPRTRVLDVCTGSGYLAVTAALLGAQATAVDVSRRAVACARANARLNGVRVRALRGDLLAAVPGERFDVIVSNPPYVPAGEPEPPRRGAARAWDAGLDGRVILDRLLDAAPAHLRPGGRLLVVHSSLIGEDETLGRMRAAGLEAETVRRRPGALGPLMRARVEHLEAQGLLAPGVREEDVIVVRGVRPATVGRDGARRSDPHPAHAQGLRA